MLDLTKAFTGTGTQAQIEFFNVFIFGQGVGSAFHDDAPIFQNIAVIGMLQRDHGILFGKQEADALLFVQGIDDFKNFFDQLRSQAHRRFIKQDHFRARHQRPANGGHLLFAARCVSGLTTAALFQAREIMIDLLERLVDRSRPVGAGVGPGQQVFLDGHVHVFRLAGAADDDADEVIVAGGPLVTADMPGKVVKVLVSVGDEVAIGTPLLILEAMKMEAEIPAPLAGRIVAIMVEQGRTVGQGELLLEIEPPAGEPT